jgi:eukaryotic-like serine/threonine-protein kinase
MSGRSAAAAARLAGMNERTKGPDDTLTHIPGSEGTGTGTLSSRSGSGPRTLTSLDGPTRNGTTVVGSSRSGTSLPSASTVDALRLDEIGRISLFARGTFALCGVGIACAPLLRGDPLAKKLLIAALAVAGCAAVWLHWVTKKPARFSHRKVILAVQVEEFAATAAAYYFGAFSSFASVVSLAIYVYSLGASLSHALACYLNLAIGQAVLSGLIMTGTIADRGLIVAGDLPMREQIIIQFCIQSVYLLALLLGRGSRRKTMAAIESLNTAVRQVAQREALLKEAQQELARAAWVGGPGRFTDQVLGSFELGIVIGRGAMGEVYRARHIETGEPAAVKLLQRSVLSDGAHVARFAREAQIISAISSPYVVRVLQVGDGKESLPYLALELLEGQDLARYLRAAPVLEQKFIVELVDQVAAGLTAAHGVGVVHRDLKPQNLFHANQPDGSKRWKILDFGVSKLTTGEGTLTQGRAIGTPAYMSPEQAKTGETDHRGDVYSLGVIAYRCLTGRPPFSGNDLGAIVYDIVHNMPPAPSEFAKLSLEVEAVLAIAMAKSPAHRFQNARELADALAGAVAGSLADGYRKRALELLRRRPWGNGSRRRAPTPGASERP